MAIFATLFGIIGRYTGKALTTTLGWASTLLFGRVRQDRQVVLAAMTFGSIVWIVLLAGVVVPDLGTMLLGFVPVPEFVDETWVRLAMLVAAIVLPPVVGAATLLFIDADRRPHGGGLVAQLLRGYPLTAALAVVLAFLAFYGVLRKLRVLVKRWSDIHVPLVVHPGHYEDVVGDIERALDDAGLRVDRRAAPAALALPGRILARVAGASSLVPERLAMLVGEGVEILVHQADIAVSGSKAAVPRARAAIASRLTTSAASMTTSDTAVGIEDRIRSLVDASRTAGGGVDHDTAERLRTIDALLAMAEIDAGEWETLYRMRLQVERDLLVGSRPGESMPGDPAGTAVGRRVPGSRVRGVGAPGTAAALGVGALLALDLLLAGLDRVRGRSGGARS